ncbi:toxin-antitoxin system YwqK family antitoxin [Carboxylicivirga caseinilyticus]|uniref:toxin-antitoxin system YwqK family antitoxin n=1 Tax=Carboxylicivirga caseinilyticus TaxID=3417572 RepID=UPI003D32D0D9|nr:hypothetical protein [Marinilabiliaceae bacterium A049]
MKNLSIILTLSIFVLSGCQFFAPETSTNTSGNKNPDGTVIKKTNFNNDPSAPVEWETTYKLMEDGPAVKHGLAKRYYKTGKLAETFNYVNNKKEGLRTTYHGNGKVYKEQMYKNDRLDGICKRYDRDGNLVAEYPYKGGLPGVGLKEYTNLGVERPAPVLSIKEENNIRTSNNYIITCSLVGEAASKIKSVDFYHGDLIEGKYYHKNLTPLRPISDTKGQLTINVPKGASLNKSLNFVAVAKTKDGLTYILQKKIAVDVRGV